MKSILIVTEQFTLGGLETHIRGEIQQLYEQGFEVHLATGKAFDRAFLPACVTTVSSGLCLEPSATTEDLLVAINQLRAIIKSRRIDAVHVHPFTSIISAVAAAELESVPFAITLHGPASLASYGAIYDFLIRDVILAEAGLVVAVSQEVRNLLDSHVNPNAIAYIPNSVSFTNANLVPLDQADPDPRWLVVSRLDEFKVPGILDFCNKAKICGISGVLIAGDGPAKPDLIEALKIKGLSKYATLTGNRADISELMHRSSGVAGMGRVVLEAVAAKKPLVLVGYDGVKGVVDAPFLKLASEANFSGRGLPTLGLEEFSEQLRMKLAPEIIFGNHQAAKDEFDESNAWRLFTEHLRKMKSIRSTAITGLYHSLRGVRINGEMPYLQSMEIMDRLTKVVNSKKYYDPRLVSSVLLYQQQLGRTQRNHSAVAERDGQITNLNQTLAERDGQITNLNQTLAERDGQITNLNQTLAERDGQITNLNQTLAECGNQLSKAGLYIEDKEIYIAMLKHEMEKIKSRFDHKIFNHTYRLMQLPYFSKRTLTILKSRGFAGLMKAIADKLEISEAGNSNNYIQPQTSVSLAPVNISSNYFSRLEEQPLLGDALVIVTGVPFDDVGGGQRAAQLARCALKTGRRVVFLHVYKKFDFEVNQHVESQVEYEGLVHKFIDDTSPFEVLSIVSPEATLLLEFPHSKALPYLSMFKSRGIRTIFELIDDWESSLGGDWFNPEDLHRFVHEAQFVVGTAKLLVEKLRVMGRNDSIYLPNAANEYIFDKYKRYERPSDLPSKPRKIALYFGSLYGDWFAWDYLHEAAKSNPDISFVLIGDKPSNQSMLSLPCNVIFLGGKKIEELPAYLAYSEISLLPFSPGKFSDSVSPIKIFEYLFSGTPVVATNLPEIAGYPGVSIAKSEGHFSALCKQVSFTDESKIENDRFIFENSWFSRLEKLSSLGTDSEFHLMTSVVILIHNNKSIIGRCLESLLLHSAHYLKEVIVVDNASIDGGAEFVQERFPSVIVLRNPVNGCSSGRNLGANFASGKYLAFFDSDQWFTSSSCFREALTILSRDANVGAVAWGAGWFETGRSDLGGKITDYCLNRAMNDIAVRRGYRSDVGYLATCGFFLPRSIFNSTEGFDVAYDPTCFEDTDMSFQIKRLGFDICYRDLTGIRHQPHQTTQAASGGDSYKILFKRNAEYFKNKWAAHPHFFVDYVIE